MRICFKNKILLLGYGTIGRCFLPLLARHARVALKNITVIDAEDLRGPLQPWIQKGVVFRRERLTRQNLIRVLGRNVAPGGLIVDLSSNVDCLDILPWVSRNHILYINASLEDWLPGAKTRNQPHPNKSLYQKYVKLLEMKSFWPSGSGSATAVLDHGANPGLISHFVRRGLLDLAKRLLREGAIAGARAAKIERYAANRMFASLAMSLGVKAVHCSEQDTQTPVNPKNNDEFVGTWNPWGLAEEAVAPVEIGWGTHEKHLPPHAAIPCYGPQNQIVLSQMGLSTLARSWVPHREYVGMVIVHGESFTISNLLTVRKKNGGVRYRPTVCYIYLPANETMASLHELRCRGYQRQSERRIMRDDIRRGEDIMGALIMGHAYKSWWTGSILDIKGARRLLPNQNATAIQVGIGVVAAVLWMLKNPAAGLCFPEDLPCDEILDMARPYLGKFVSIPVPWTPLVNYRAFSRDNQPARPYGRNTWQFDNFLVKP
ncbi:MAG: saccharopine dehydrogenase C-terminal domain-containing protein [Kiritimatiellae bacterium]|nr:saccharopine dehydrogenase C-terminal domain-containing protein [Kiritimatiellia bacterium]